jgi:hypothetical protein
MDSRIATQEEIVGMIEDDGAKPTAVMSDAAARQEQSDYNEELPAARNSSGPAIEASFYYDSDSDESQQKDSTATMIQPIVLPDSALQKKGAEPISDTQTSTSMFADVMDKDQVHKEAEGWFLVQLPTRLPPLQKPVEQTGELAAVPSAPEVETTKVNVSPTQTDRFDNSLATAVPGRLGKIVVYSSGKTVLVLEGPDGGPSVSTHRMLVG